ncbi:rubrerythrin-like domain-containing protein [Haladaptatus pallidirubidus]|uniref:rubrerythrin-like domain-containing protein n=1 Tax=Haladaptatus pallidirubidus TaxID=1008152 RepID=UPI0031E73D15
MKIHLGNSRKRFTIMVLYDSTAMIQHTPPNTGAEARKYECQACLYRVNAMEYRAICPECQGKLRNITVPRE